ncbi:HAMP domain-containing histidine kinase [Aggregicoccus sp. 17bor-14]|uniref:sensor histidine kinase n=1 Tax=Myxococcaceae TaxID=31 RepID=UPI00129CBB80|nr:MULTISPECIES: HAMP domain-containing sensor histidine kinase [Myxococcaceae]MBF5041610.1 HAMP domain-containing histidine kinase [Simulacricoccus sp. 17bor-14]MRI87395.1 HAMP domain-containing histidine kinase [Aggregicoccus sp. 17bor-14]
MRPTQPAGFREIQHQEFERLFGRLVWARFFALPLLGTLVGWLALLEPAPWRRTVLLGVLVLIPTFFAVEVVRYRRQGLTRRAVPLNLTLGVGGILLVLFATGGLSSPFLYVLLPVTLMVGLLLPPRLVLGLVGTALVAVWAFALLGAGHGLPDFNPEAFGGGTRAAPSLTHLYFHAGFLSLALLFAATVGRSLRGGFDAVLLRTVRAQEDALHAHAERTQELTALSAEIAHELKNPLASLKGLGGLLTQNVPEGKGAERLAILRGEVERMQGILEEFLTFSRPLLPLSAAPTDLAALCAEVVSLHEGLAQERGVTLSLLPGGATVQCDARKVKQVLINLVQNALEASPAGGEVAFEVGLSPGGGARVLVLDRGRGPDAGLLPRLFEPGVTTKARGNGVGLTIARALARQHGGELQLSARPGGGAVAELWLPAAPPLRAEEAAA